MLHDQETYINIKTNPVNKLTNSVRLLLTRQWTKNNYIMYNQYLLYKKVFCSDEILPRSYRLLKIHKLGNSFRIIISSIDSLLSLASYSHKIIFNNIPKSFSHIDNSFQLVKRLNGSTLNSDFVFVSLDVVSLFTNIRSCYGEYFNRWTHIFSGCNIHIFSGCNIPKMNS